MEERGILSLCTSGKGRKAKISPFCFIKVGEGGGLGGSSSEGGGGGWKKLGAIFSLKCSDYLLANACKGMGTIRNPGC